MGLAVLEFDNEAVAAVAVASARQEPAADMACWPADGRVQQKVARGNDAELAVGARTSGTQNWAERTQEVDEHSPVEAGLVGIGGRTREVVDGQNMRYAEDTSSASMTMSTETKETTRRDRMLT